MTSETSVFVVATEEMGERPGETVRAIFATREQAEALAERLANDEGRDASANRYILGKRYDEYEGEDGVFIMGASKEDAL